MGWVVRETTLTFGRVDKSRTRVSRDFLNSNLSLPSPSSSTHYLPPQSSPGYLRLPTQQEQLNNVVCYIRKANEKLHRLRYVRAINHLLFHLLIMQQLQNQFFHTPNVKLAQRYLVMKMRTLSYRNAFEKDRKMLGQWTLPKGSLRHVQRARLQPNMVL